MEKTFMNRSLLSLATVGLLAALGAAAPASFAQYPSYPYQNQPYPQQYSQPDPPQSSQYNQYDRPSRQFNVGIARLGAGTVISAAPSQETGGTLYLNTDRSYPGTLLVAEDVLDTNGNVALPAGTEIRGTFRPVKGGQRFYAESAVVNGRFFTVRATSQTLRDVKDPRYTGGGKIATDAAIGAAGGALLGWALGNPGTGAIAGALGGGVIGNVTAPQVVVVDQNNPIDLKLQAPLTLRY
jgi:uncharacterized protein YcfJ